MREEEEEAKLITVVINESKHAYLLYLYSFFSFLMNLRPRRRRLTSSV